MIDLSKYPTLLKFRAYAGDQEDAEAFDRELEEMRAEAVAAITAEADRITCCGACGSQVVLRSKYDDGRLSWCPACAGPGSCGPSVQRVRRASRAATASSNRAS